MVHVVITAAGLSKRMKGIDKLFFLIKGKPLLYWTLINFVNLTSVDTIILVVNPDKLLEIKKLVTGWKFTKTTHIIPGGTTRQESVSKGINDINRRASDSDLILVHDGARPLIAPKEIKRVLKTIGRNNAAILAVPVKETVKKANSTLRIAKTINRNNLWLAQTPQGATLKTFKKALNFASRNQIQGTDESGLFESAGIPVKIVEGSYANIKVTTWEDLEIVRRLL